MSNHEMNAFFDLVQNYYDELGMTEYSMLLEIAECKKKGIPISFELCEGFDLEATIRQAEVYLAEKENAIIDYVRKNYNKQHMADFFDLIPQDCDE